MTIWSNFLLVCRTLVCSKFRFFFLVKQCSRWNDYLENSLYTNKIYNNIWTFRITVLYQIFKKQLGKKIFKSNISFESTKIKLPIIQEKRKLKKIVILQCADFQIKTEYAKHIFNILHQISYSLVINAFSKFVYQLFMNDVYSN